MDANKQTWGNRHAHAQIYGADTVGADAGATTHADHVDQTR